MRFILVVLATTALISPVMAQQEQNRPATAPQTQTAPSATSQSAPASASDRGDRIRSELRERIIERVEQRLADFKTALRLAPEQETRWPAFESGVRDFLRVRAEQLSTMREAPPSTPADRLRRRADSLAAMSGALKRLADAEEPLYTTLSDAQKDRFRDFVWLIRRPGTELEDRDRFSEGDRFRDHDRWSYRYPTRRHMRDEDDEDGRDRRDMMRRHRMSDDDGRDRRDMMRRHHMSDEDGRDRRDVMRRHHMSDEDGRDWNRQSMWRDRESRHGCPCSGAMRHRWRDECDRSRMDDD